MSWRRPDRGFLEGRCVQYMRFVERNDKRKRKEGGKEGRKEEIGNLTKLHLVVYGFFRFESRTKFLSDDALFQKFRL